MDRYVVEIELGIAGLMSIKWLKPFEINTVSSIKKKQWSLTNIIS